jgi:hypothetical protein
MIPVHVGDENAPQLRNPNFTSLNLVLGAFPTVKEPNFSPLGKS